MGELRERMDVAAEAAWRAGRLTLRWFQTGVSVDAKEDGSPVTAADREAEARLLDELRGRYPADAVFGEEGGERPGTSGWRWVVDPIDGTKSFVQGVPLYGVLVGLEDPSGEPVAGAACFPALGELVVAARGEGCHWNGRRARVSGVARLEAACVLGTGPECFAAAKTRRAAERLAGRARVARGWGDAYGHCLVATGRAEAMVDPVLADWDCAALLPIVEEAGGVFTDWTGARTARGRSGVSTNAALAREVRAVLAEEDRERAPET